MSLTRDDGAQIHMYMDCVKVENWVNELYLHIYGYQCRGLHNLDTKKVGFLNKFCWNTDFKLSKRKIEKLKLFKIHFVPC